MGADNTGWQKNNNTTGGTKRVAVCWAIVASTWGWQAPGAALERAAMLRQHNHTVSKQRWYSMCTGMDMWPSFWVLCDMDAADGQARVYSSPR